MAVEDIGRGIEEAFKKAGASMEASGEQNVKFAQEQYKTINDIENKIAEKGIFLTPEEQSAKEAMGIRERAGFLRNKLAEAAIAEPQKKAVGESLQKYALAGGTEDKLDMKALQAEKDPLKQQLIIGKAMSTTPEFQMRKERQARLDQQAYQNQFNSKMQFGGVVDPIFIKDYKDKGGVDLLPQLQAGRGEVIENPDGTQSWRILSNPEWEAKVKEGVLGDKERDFFTDLKDEYDSWSAVENGLQKLGVNWGDVLDPNSPVTFESTQNPLFQELGFFSIPARVNLAAQYAKDPKYMSIKREIELGFAKFRKRVTGAQAAAQELTYLRDIIPSLQDKPEVFRETIKALHDSAKRSFENRLDLMTRTGRNVKGLDGYLDGSTKALVPTAAGGYAPMTNVDKTIIGDVSYEKDPNTGKWKKAKKG